MITDLGLDLAFYIAAAICFALATANVKVGTINLVALGLLAMVLAALF
jgi:hypothetical protein